MALVNYGKAVYLIPPPGFDEFGLADDDERERDESKTESPS